MTGNDHERRSRKGKILAPLSARVEDKNLMDSNRVGLERSRIRGRWEGSTPEGSSLGRATGINKKFTGQQWVSLFGVVAFYWTSSTTGAKHRAHDNKTVPA